MDLKTKKSKIMDDIKAKQQVVEKIKEASKILVTVSDSPSVDALSAALGLTLLFDKQEKYATALFSGEIPPAIAFLKPEKTFDDTTDSLRDFIIALDKEKADHLRMPKPEPGDDMVRIYVTPYKTTITKDDLEFSQGDYNVELVIALGVDEQEHLDKALESHGQILHDATVITISAGDQTSNLGGIDWHDAGASSLSEMISGLGEALKEDKKKPLIDATIATALLTGIVAETERFSNQHTTSKVMTVAAQLMSAGADQQLIATELQTKPAVAELPEEEPEETPDGDNGTDTESPVEDEVKEVAPVHKDEFVIDHHVETLSELDERVREKHPEEVETEAAVEVESEEEPEPTPEVEPERPELQPEKPAETEAPQVEPETPEPEQPAKPAYVAEEIDAEPSFGGTLNATTEQAAEDAQREALSDQNKTILSHAYIGNSPAQASTPMQDEPTGFPGTPQVAPGSTGINDVNEEVHSAYALKQDEAGAHAQSPFGGTTGERVIEPLPQAPVAPAAPVDLGLPLPPPLPDFSMGTLPPVPSLPPVFSSQPSDIGLPQAPAQPEILGDILKNDPPTLPPVGAYSHEETPPTASETLSDPAQFKIPT